jgi:Kef-type K+ transport system membrane component KefB
MIAFVLGGGLTPGRLRARGRAILVVSGMVALASLAAVGAGLWAAGLPVALAALLGGIATATDPAAVTDVVREEGARGRFPDLLLGTVAVDDAWGLILFSLVLAGLSAAAGLGAGEAMLTGLHEIGGAVAVGLGIGLPAAALTGRIRPGAPTQAEGLGVVFLCAGLAALFEVSVLLAGMIAGAAVSNLARHHTRPLHEIERVQWPFLVLFFLLAGASVELSGVAAALLPFALFLALRALGRLAGGWLGGRLSGLPAAERQWLGPALLPQAGVAVGMALVAAEHFPEHRDTLVAVAVASTVVFEVVGPVLTRLALRRVARG